MAPLPDPDGCDRIDLVVHGPPGSAPPVLADAFLAGAAELGTATRRYDLVSRGADPGIDAMNLLAGRPGDGNVLSTCTPVFLQAPLLRGLPLTHRGLTPLARLVGDHFFLVGRADGRFPDAASFLSAVRRTRTRTGGYFLGGINHLLALALGDAIPAEIDFVVTASEPAVWDALVAGDIDWGCGVAAELLPHLARGDLRVLAALDATRHAPFPDVPSAAELGLPVRFSMWRGLIGPAALSDAQQSAWHDAIGAVTRTTAWRRYLDRTGQVDAFLPGGPFRAFLDDQWRWYERHLGLAGLLRPRADPER